MMKPIESGVAEGDNEGNEREQQVALGNQEKDASLPTDTAATDASKRRVIRQQLVVLLHAFKCRENENAGERIQCDVTHCQTMKNVINHMRSCRRGDACRVAFCKSSSQIMRHWKHCSCDLCPVCGPVREAQRRTTANMENTAKTKNVG